MTDSGLLIFNSTIRSLFSSGENKEGLCIFIGAGADIASGGITFLELKKKCLMYEGVTLPSEPSQLAIDSTFDEYFSSLRENERCIVLERILRETRKLNPSDGYKLLTLMAREKAISSVITTNFDDLLEKTGQSMGIDAFQVFSPGISLPLLYPISHKPHKTVYLKMHGDVDGRLVTHLTRDEISSKEYQSEYKKLLNHLIHNKTVIIAGYSGYDGKIAEVFEEALDSLSNVFWCNPSPLNKEAPLVKVLSTSDKYHYIQTDFDNAMEMVASEVFRDRMIFHSSSVFIWPLIKAKIKIIQDRYIERYYSQAGKMLTVRTDALNAYNRYIIQTHKNLFILCGSQGIGKSTFIAQILKKDENEGLFVVPVSVPGSLTPNAPTYLMENLGYVTSTPITVICQMAEWLQDQNKNVVFAFDGIGNGTVSRDSISKYVSNIIEIAYILRHIPNVKFIISIRDDCWENVIIDLDKNYYKETIWLDKHAPLMISYMMGTFSQKELVSLIERAFPGIIHEDDFQHVSRELIDLLCEPYFCGLVLKNPEYIKKLILSDQSSAISIIGQFLGHLNIAFSEKKKLQELAREMLDNNSDSIAYGDQRDIPALANIIYVNQELGQVMFRHPMFLKYYLVCYFRTTNLVYYTGNEATLRIAQIFLTINTNRAIYDSLVLYLASPENDIDGVLKFISELVKLGEEKLEYEENANKLANDVLRVIASNHPASINHWLEYVAENSTVFNRICRYIVYSTPYMRDDSAYQILVHLRNICHNPTKLECYVLINDRFTEGLKSLGKADSDVYSKYVSRYGFAIDAANPLICIIQWNWIMGRIGPDNVPEQQYSLIARLIRDQFNRFKIKPTKQNAEDFKDSFLRNAYMIFFNANNDLEDKYYCYPAKSELVPVIQEALSHDFLSSEAINSIRNCINHFDEPIDFFVSNLVFIALSKKDQGKARDALDMLYDSYENKANVVELDFYLSALFLEEYINNPTDRTFYLSRFKRTVADYEMLLFSSPAKDRVGSSKRFSDMFDIEFEDGFNALTNYTYTAPLENYTGSREGGHVPVEEYLEVYWNLLKTLKETGNFKEILRLLQAISQMIVNWPIEGFDALNKFLPVEHQIIKRALIKILSQNYLRYPRVTMNFIDNNLSEFSHQELLSILGSTDSHIQYRTLEQLQWARMIYFIQTYIEPNIVDKVLSVFARISTLETALTNIVSLIMHPNNDES